MSGILGVESVSRETIERLKSLVALLCKWNPTINLVSRTTLPDAWNRHIADSAQLYRLGQQGHWVDLGSGGGFPGLVIAILAADSQSHSLTLIESDQRKATFLRTAARELGLNISVLAQRIENTPPQSANTLSARALAPLPKLLMFAQRHLTPDGIALFPKGANWREEVEAARQTWQFDLLTYPSATEPSGAILAVKAISNA